MVGDAGRTCRLNLGSGLLTTGLDTAGEASGLLR